MEEPEKPPQRPEQSGKNGSDANLFAIGIRYSTMGFEFVGLLLIFGYVGYRIDEHYGASPWGLFAGLMLGMGFGLFVMIRQLSKLNR